MCVCVLACLCISSQFSEEERWKWKEIRNEWHNIYLRHYVSFFNFRTTFQSKNTVKLALVSEAIQCTKMWGLLSSGMWHRANLYMCTDISEELAASNITKYNSIFALTYCFFLNLKYMLYQNIGRPPSYDSFRLPLRRITTVNITILDVGGSYRIQF